MTWISQIFRLTWRISTIMRYSPDCILGRTSNHSIWSWIQVQGPPGCGVAYANRAVQKRRSSMMSAILRPSASIRLCMIFIMGSATHTDTMASTEFVLNAMKYARTMTFRIFSLACRYNSMASLLAASSVCLLTYMNRAEMTCWRTSFWRVASSMSAYSHSASIWIVMSPEWLLADTIWKSMLRKATRYSGSRSSRKCELGGRCLSTIAHLRKHGENFQRNILPWPQKIQRQ